MLKHLVAAVALLLAFTPTAQAKEFQDRVGIFSTINVSEDQPAGDVACVFCSVNLQGDVHGDVAVLFGTVNADADRTISGDVALLFSSLNLGDNDTIKGDLATAFSTANMPSSSVVHGDRSIAASGLGIAVLAGPFLVLTGIIWLVIHLSRRNRTRSPYPV